MVAQFGIAYERTNRFEGHGLSNHYADRGGETYAGISRLHHPGWGGWPIIDRTLKVGRPLVGVDATNLSNLHQQLFRDEFWQPAGCGLLEDQDVANELYDSAVNCGVRRAVEWLQTALNTCNRRGQRWPDIAVDGKVGKQTASVVVAACANPQTRWLLLQVMETFQRAHYVQLAMADPMQEENLLGWFRLRVQQG